MAETYNRKKAEDYGSYELKNYQDSEFTTQALKNHNSLQKPVQQENPWSQTVNEALNKIQNREKFSYDLNGDALYQQYKDQYVLGGQMAMQDTIGQAAAMTGGYGNSYAQGVGQQAYQGYLQKLNDKVPELYQLALDQYNREGDDLYKQYSLYADREQTIHDRGREEVSDYKDYLNLYSNLYLTSKEQDQNAYFKGEELGYKIHSDKQDLEYRIDSDAADDFKWGQEYDQKDRMHNESMDLENKKFDEGVRQFNVGQENWEAEFEELKKDNERNYLLAVDKIKEDIRHNKITEEQGQQQINLARDELNAANIRAEAELKYKKTVHEDEMYLKAAEIAAENGDVSGIDEYLNNYNSMYTAGFEWLKSMGLTADEANLLRSRSEWAREKPYGDTYEDYIQEFYNRTMLARGKGPVKGTPSGGNKFNIYTIN